MIKPNEVSICKYKTPNGEECSVLLNKKLKENPRRCRHHSISGQIEAVLNQLENLKMILRVNRDLENIVIRKDTYSGEEQGKCLFAFTKYEEYQDWYLVKLKPIKGVVPLTIELRKEEVDDFLNLLDDIIWNIKEDVYNYE